MSFTAALILTAVIAVLARTGAWIWQLRTRNAGMVDAEMIRRKPGYDEYVGQTSALIPLPPKK
jgi:steroid 5-alpha reductase family enzyme